MAELIEWRIYELFNIPRSLQIMIRYLLLPNLHLDAFKTYGNMSIWVNQQGQSLIGVLVINIYVFK